MTRLVLFLISVVLIIVVLSVRSFHDVKIDNSRFDYEKAKESHHQIAEAIKKNEEGPSVEEAVEEKVEAVKEIVIDLNTPELKNGAQVFKNCTSCHGKNAEGKKGQKAPKLAGQYDWYIEKQLHDMKNKVRVNAVMDPYLKKLSDQDIKDVAQYISKFPW